MLFPIIGEAKCIYTQCDLWGYASCGELGTEIEGKHPETLSAYNTAILLFKFHFVSS